MFGLGHALSKHPPQVPEGGRAFISQEDVFGISWTIRVAMNGEDETRQCAKLKDAPTVAQLSTAEAFLDWVTGAAATFEYPAGRA